MMYKCVNNLVPAYINEEIGYRYTYHIILLHCYLLLEVVILSCYLYIKNMYIISFSCIIIHIVN